VILPATENLEAAFGAVDLPPPPYETLGVVSSGTSAIVKKRIMRSEIKPFESASDRKRLEELADLYSIIRTTESIETFYSEDAITEKEYGEICSRLLSQFKTMNSALVAVGAIQNAEAFTSKYNVYCPRALDRLVRVGVPATVIHGSYGDDRIIVAETVLMMSTLMHLDSVLKSMYAVGTSVYHCIGRTEARDAGGG
jgi:ESCRT-I complex subunit VPS28